MRHLDVVSASLASPTILVTYADNCPTNGRCILSHHNCVCTQAGGTGDIAFRVMAEALHHLRVDHTNHADTKEYALQRAMGRTDADDAAELLARLPQVTVLDINDSMLKVGEQRLYDGAVHRFGDAPGGLGRASSIGREGGGSHFVPPVVSSLAAAGLDAAKSAGLPPPPPLLSMLAGAMEAAASKGAAATPSPPGQSPEAKRMGDPPLAPN